MKTKKTQNNPAAEPSAPAATVSEAPARSSTAVTIPEDLILGTERRAYAGAYRRAIDGKPLAFIHLPLIAVLARGWLEGNRQRTEARIAGEVIAELASPQA